MIASPAFVTDELRRRGVLPTGEVTSIQVGQRFVAYADDVVRLHVNYTPDVDEHAPRTLICKRFGPHWYDVSGLPELRFYRDLAPLMPCVPVPTVHGAIDLPESRTCILLLEDLTQRYVVATLPIADTWLEHLIDVLIHLHVCWWQHPRLGTPEFIIPQQGVTRMAQALSQQAIGVNEAQGRQTAERFLEEHHSQLTAGERELVTRLAHSWGTVFRERLMNGNAITLIHGDLHLLGNIFLATAPFVNPRIKIIDWSQVKRGLGPHDVMFALLSVDAADRVERDTALLHRYHEGLQQAGVAKYSWEQCIWDYRFSLLTNIFQSLFQDSLHWFRKTVLVVQTWDSMQLLEQSP